MMAACCFSFRARKAAMPTQNTTLRFWMMAIIPS